MKQGLRLSANLLYNLMSVGACVASCLAQNCKTGYRNGAYGDYELLPVFSVENI